MPASVSQAFNDDEASLLPVVVDGPALARMEISTWRTDAGAFDVLTDIPDRDGRRRLFDELAVRADHRVVGGVAVRVAALDDVIASKEWADRPKDHQALPELHRLRRVRIATDREVEPGLPHEWPQPPAPGPGPGPDPDPEL